MLLAIFFPFLSFLFRGKIISAIVCFILQVTLVGWLPVSIWAVMSLYNSRAEKRNQKIIKTLEEMQFKDSKNS